MNKFKIGDRVSFEWQRGDRRKGTITKLINSSVRIDCDDCCWMESTIEALNVKRLVKKKRECPHCVEHKARIHDLLEQLSKEVQKNHAPVNATDWCINCLSSNTKLNLMQLKLDELQKMHITREKLAEAWNKVHLLYWPAPHPDLLNNLCKELGL